MNSLVSTERYLSSSVTSATCGKIHVVPSKAVWLLFHGVLGLTGMVFFPAIDAFTVFLILTAVTICAGHSVGMHRLLIHRSFETTKAIEFLLVWLGTLVGMAGPIGMIKTHDMRDWHQRQKDCPPHPSHDTHFIRDAWWQLCCEFKLERPPQFILEDRVHFSRMYSVMERTWMLQQVPLALALFGLGGIAWVFWGCSLRIFVSLVGHWMVGHFAHKRGQQGWRIAGLPVQGFNLPRLGLITFGENWHGNHHAFPHSARLGIEKGQTDPGFWLITILERIGFVWNVKLPDSAPPREGLMRI
ncbi:acyl-CoA desaturase [Leisingera sp. M658]|uniref:acyl-CoA desaturase n=1 Tax=Leisingera sp. M658 TaxID=2867015 RepID=UPI0021A65D29|nr:acyl-CoA desaturase [Leisingera sp. M658]UWQ76577.1 acyl-CoA desaturase [Leisingera sp. M658]